MWQQALIAVAVVVACAYVLWSFSSLQGRQRVLDALARHDLFVRQAAQHRTKLALPGCGKCSGAAVHKARRG